MIKQENINRLISRQASLRTVFLCLAKGSCPGLKDLSSPRQGFFISWEGRTMKTTREMSLCEELVRQDIPVREWEKRQIRRDAQRFEEYTRNNVSQALAKVRSI